MQQPRQRTGVNWELLRREGGQLLARQPGWLAVGLAGPLLITFYTMLRPWRPGLTLHNLLQAALFFSAWSILFQLCYTLAAWLRPRQEQAERELLHLPLSTVHFALRRLQQTSLLPLAAALLALPLWGVLLFYCRLPYGIGADQQSWSWSGEWISDPWWVRVAWLVACQLSGTLLCSALAAWLEALTALRYLRCLLLLAIPVGLYFVIELAYGWSRGSGLAWSAGWSSDYGPLIMNYRQTRGVSPWPYLALLALCLTGPLLMGWLRPAGRWVLLCLPVLLCGTLLLLRAMPVGQLPLLRASTGRDLRYAGALFIGHLSPPRNMRLLFGSDPSNLLFKGHATASPPVKPAYPQLPPEPDYPAQYDETSAEYRAYVQADDKWQSDTAAEREAYSRAMDAYYAADEAYEAQKEHWPRLALWVGAGLYPLLLPLWAVAGLLLGIGLRGEPARE
jgi:hypothetical protein